MLSTWMSAEPLTLPLMAFSWKSWQPMARTGALFAGFRTGWMARPESCGEWCHIQLAAKSPVVSVMGSGGCPCTKKSEDTVKIAEQVNVISHVSNKYILPPGCWRSCRAGEGDREWLPSGRGRRAAHHQGVPWMKTVCIMLSLLSTPGPHFISPPQECPVSSSCVGPMHEIRSQQPMDTPPCQHWLYCILFLFHGINPTR